MARESVSGAANAESLAAVLRSLEGLSEVEEAAPLAPHTSWRVGGPADLLCVATTVDGLCAAIRGAVEHDVPWRVLGRGSNVLVRDGGVEGLVILNRTVTLEIVDTLVRADSGLLLSTLARKTATAGLAGLEWSAGIPGSVGGSVVSNAGAHGGAMADTLQQVEILDQHGHRTWVKVAALQLAYRHSRFRDSRAAAETVLRAEFELVRDDPAAIRGRMDEQKRHRKATQPLANASAGSVFKNPPGESAARLIDQSGLKGMCIGGATVSTRHANFMVAAPGARASDLLSLIDVVRERVRAKYGVELDLEVLPIGRQAPTLA
ncbi:MAG: UDP-N-acetylenolpyruvoylglucosamine reductase [Chloroflexi bacterium]|nr:UDP-N-acetylenolpyruvoylglucosamine reductase [Chloroflexota bacterium]